MSASSDKNITLLSLFKNTASWTFYAMNKLLICSLVVACAVGSVTAKSHCRFANDFTCEDFQSKSKIDEYLTNVVHWEGQFAQPGIGYDPASGYTYDGHPLNYSTGGLYGEPHTWSAPSKESIHLSILALAVDGNKYAQQFAGGFDKAIETLELKIKGYFKFNETYPGYGCFTPWVGFNATEGTYNPIESWTIPYNKAPGLDNGEWFWAIYATVHALKKLGPKYAKLTKRYNDFMTCQKVNAKTIFYRGDGDVSATVFILDPKSAPSNASNYVHDQNWLNDPYEGETMTQMLYLFSDWESEEERELLWTKKRGLFEKVDYTVPETALLSAGLSKGENNKITVQRGYWFSSHEQWKTLLMPYLSKELPLVRKVFANAEKARTWDAYLTNQPGLLASINDVTDGSQDIPSYASACGVAELAFQPIQRRDIMTPYGAYGLFLHEPAVGFCWYNNMLRGPRMQNAYGSTEAVNVNGTEISPLTTWDSKITTVLAMLGGVGDIVEQGLRTEHDSIHGTAYNRFVYVVNREHVRVFGSVDQVKGDNIPYKNPGVTIPMDKLTEWDLTC